MNHSLHASASDAGAVAIVLSYLRPHNIAQIVRQLALVTRVARIVVSNNNPDIDLAPLLPTEPKLSFIQQPQRFGAWKRFEIAAQLDARYFLCIDDDLFLSSPQIEHLLDALYQDPSIPHGIWGERILMSEKGLRFKSGVWGADAPLDIINRCYAFTKQHATRLFRLAALLGLPEGNDLGPVDDILLSFTGNTAPRCHAVGPLEECRTSHQAGIAVWRQPDFYQSRAQLIWRMLGLPADSAEWWTERTAALRYPA